MTKTQKIHSSALRLMEAAAAAVPPDTEPVRIAERLGVALQTFWNWRTRGVSGDGARRAQNAYGVDATWILEGGHAGRVMTVQARVLPKPSDARAALPPPVSPDATLAGYISMQLLEGAGGMGDGMVNDDYPEVIREVEMAEWMVRQQIGFVPRAGRIKLLTGRGPSMRPRIEHGDVVMVDTDVTTFDDEGIYVIAVDGGTQIKVLQRRVDGLYIVSINPDYPAYRADNVHVRGKVLGVIGMREM